MKDLRYKFRDNKNDVFKEGFKRRIKKNKWYIVGGIILKTAITLGVLSYISKCNWKDKYLVEDPFKKIKK